MRNHQQLATRDAALASADHSTKRHLLPNPCQTYDNSDIHHDTNRNNNSKILSRDISVDKTYQQSTSNLSLFSRLINSLRNKSEHQDSRLNKTYSKSFTSSASRSSNLPARNSNLMVKKL